MEKCTATWVAFAGTRRLAMGIPSKVAVCVKKHIEAMPSSSVMIFDSITSERIELDLQVSTEQLLRRLPSYMKSAAETDPPARGAPGRPKLGVVGREVTLLPRHWQWLADQPGGASAALRRLVEQAARQSAGSDALRYAQNATYEFIIALAGDEPGFEEALRALFSGNLQAFAKHTQGWPADVREHALVLAKAAQ